MSVSSSPEHKRRVSSRKKAAMPVEKESPQGRASSRKKAEAKVFTGGKVREQLEARLSEPPTVDQAAKTEIEPPRSRAVGKGKQAGKSKSSRQQEGEKGGHSRKSGASQGQIRSGWQRLDRVLIWGVLVVLVLGVAAVWGVNEWSRSRGAELHPLAIAQWPDRMRAFFCYVRQVGGPSLHRSSSLGYEKEIQQAALRYRLQPALLKAIIAVESNFDSWKTDRFGAMGVMQVTPDVAELYGEQARIFIPKINIAVGARFLRKQYQDLKHWDKAILAYHHTMRGLAMPSLEQGQGYVGRVKTAMQLYEKDPGHYIRKLVKQNKKSGARWSFRQWVRSWFG